MTLDGIVVSDHVIRGVIVQRTLAAMLLSCALSIAAPVRAQSSGAAADTPIDVDALMAQRSEAVQNLSTALPSLDVRALLQKVLSEAGVYAQGAPVTPPVVDAFVQAYLSQHSQDLKQEAAQLLRDYSARILLGASVDDGAQVALLALLAHLSSVQGDCLALDASSACVMAASSDPGVAAPFMQLQDVNGNVLASSSPIEPEVALAAVQPILTACGSPAEPCPPQPPKPPKPPSLPSVPPTLPPAPTPSPAPSSPIQAKILSTAVFSQHGPCQMLFSNRTAVTLPNSVPLPYRQPALRAGPVDVQVGDSSVAYYGTGPCPPGNEMLFGDFFTTMLIEYGTSRDIVNVQVPFAFECSALFGSISCTSALVVCALAQAYFGADYQYCIQSLYNKVTWPVHSYSFQEHGLVQTCATLPAAPAQERPGFLLSAPALKSKGLNYGTSYQYPVGTGIVDAHMYPLPTDTLVGAPLAVVGAYEYIRVVSWHPNIYYAAAESANATGCRQTENRYGYNLYGDAWNFFYGSTSLESQFGYVPYLQVIHGTKMFLGQNWPFGP